MKKTIALFLTLCLLFSLAGCKSKETGKPAPTANQPAGEKTPAAEVANPMRESTPEEIVNETGLSFSDPIGAAENVRYFLYDTDPVMAEMRFSVNGTEYNYRMAPSAFGKEKIDGMYYSWSSTAEVELQHLTAEARWIEGQQGVIGWFDLVPGMLYSLSMDSKASEEALSSMAKVLFVPLQGEVDGDVVYGEMSEEVSADLRTLLSRVSTECRPGTAGSTLCAAALCGELCDLFTQSNPAPQAVAEIMQGYLSELDPDALYLYRTQIESVKDQFDSLMGENAADVLSSCGYEAKSSWDETQLTPLFSALNVSAPLGSLSPTPRAPLPEGGELDAYSAVLASYLIAKYDGWDAGELSENGLNYMAADSRVGYLFKDLDGDGVKELLIIPDEPDNDFLNALVYDLYTLDEKNAPKLVFQSRERDRLYCMDGALFIHQGSNGAADSFDTVEQYENGALTDLGYTAEEKVMPEISPLS